MRSRLLLMLVFIMALSAFVVSAADEVTGTLTVNEKAVPVRHVYALLHDNAERVLGSPTQLRILITDREVPLELLYGLIFLPVEDLAGRGEVQGILLQFDPAKKGGDVDMTVLMPKVLRKDTDRITIKDFELGPDHLKGSFEYAENSFLTVPEYPKAKFNFRISAAVHRSPSVTADLKGKAAINSPQIKALRTIADAMTWGDFAALEKLSSERANRKNKQAIEYHGVKAKSFFASNGAQLKKMIPKVRRIVVRSDHAVIDLSGKTWSELVFVDGKWKAN